MLKHTIEPRSSETNATGHIDHTVIPVWFELARNPVYKIFNPELSLSTWNTVIRKIDIDYTGQIFHNRETEVWTRIGAIRTTSFQVQQELWQEHSLVARSNTVLVYFDYGAQEKLEIPKAIRAQLTAL